MALRKFEDPGPFFTVKQAANHEGVSEKTLRRAMDRRKLAFYDDPIRISKMQLDDWRRRRLVPVEM